MNEEELLEQQRAQEEEAARQAAEASNQPVAQAPSTVSYSEEQVQRALSMQARNLESAMTQARQAREEAEALRRQYEQRPAQQTYNFDEMNERATNGQFAQVQADIVRTEMQRLMQPLLQQNAQTKKEQNTQTFVDAAISAHMYPDFARTGRDHLITYVRGALGNREPDEFVIKSLVDGAIGQAVAQNPTMIADFYNQRTAPASAPAAPASSPKPIPHRVPTGRPLVSASPGGDSILDEGEKRIKAQNPDWVKMSDEQWKEEFYAPDQVVSFDLNKLMNPGAKK